jgi:dTDP-glucose 4,6-dehydratase
VPFDRVLENRISGDGGLDIVVNMASDSAVERSVSDPGNCWRNNCELVYNVLEFARRNRPEAFFQISTDEVYGDCGEGPGHHEWDVICPSNPYAASKAAQEALAISYFRSFGVPVVITNCMNVIGARQDREKFLPKIIWKVATDQVMDIYANLDGAKPSVGSRFYLHAQNHADALVWLSGRSVSSYPAASRPDRYNIVGDVELDNLELALLVAEIMGKKLKYRLVASESARPGYDMRYALDGSKIREAGWVPPLSFRRGLEQIIDWTMGNPWWI